MNAIINTKLILEDGIIFDGVLLYENDRIMALGKRGTVQIPADANIIDAKGLYTAPGLIDVHNHGGPDHLFHEEPEECCRFFLTHGQTTVLPTFYMTLNTQQMLEGLEKVQQASKTAAGKIIGGIYMEGPYMCPIGSNQKYIVWNGPIDRKDYQPLLDAMAGYAKVWAIDPAREGIEGFMEDVKQADPKAVFAMGHSWATAAQCRKLRKYGLTLQTHHGDSGNAPGRNQVSIGAGCDHYTLYEPDVYAELICDEMGVHVDEDMVKFVVRTKGVERMILITDHMADKDHFTNNEADGVLYGSDLNYDYEGHLAGSHLTLENACRNMMTHTGYGLCHAIRMATLNPARMLGIDQEVGSLEAGKKANLILIDDTVRVKSVILEGQLAVQDGQILL